MSKLWTDEQNELLRTGYPLCKTNKQHEALAKKLKRTVAAMERRARQLGLPRNESTRKEVVKGAAAPLARIARQQQARAAAGAGRKGKKSTGTRSR